MNTAIINIKTNPLVKEKAQEIAGELGFSLSSLINAYLKHLIKTKTVYFNASENPTEYLISALEESKKDIEQNRVSTQFTKAKDAISWLNDPQKRYKNEN